jgi:hypothetical protein
LILARPEIRLPRKFTFWIRADTSSKLPPLIISGLGIPTPERFIKLIPAAIFDKSESIFGVSILAPGVENAH